MPSENLTDGNLGRESQTIPKLIDISQVSRRMGKITKDLAYVKTKLFIPHKSHIKYPECGDCSSNVTHRIVACIMLAIVIGLSFVGRNEVLGKINK